MRAGAAGGGGEGRGEARRVGGGGCGSGGKGWGWSRGKKAGGLGAVFVAATETGSPRVAPRLPCHYLGPCTAPSPLATKTFR